MSSLPDAINGGWELVGTFFTLINVRQVLKDKAVAGVSWIPVAYWSGWGVWNLFYYPHLGQWLSFTGGVFVVIANTTYLALLLYYSRVRKCPNCGANHPYHVFNCGMNA